MTADKAAVARQMYASGEHTVAAIAATLGVSRATVYRTVAPPTNGRAGGGRVEPASGPE